MASQTQQGGSAGTGGGTALGDSPTPPLGNTVSSSNDPLVGRVLSHYRLDERLGAGGMGVLYRATDLKLGRAVAIKLLARHRVSEETAKARFDREARAARRADEPDHGRVATLGANAWKFSTSTSSRLSRNSNGCLRRFAWCLRRFVPNDYYQHTLASHVALPEEMQRC